MDSISQKKSGNENLTSNIPSNQRSALIIDDSEIHLHILDSYLQAMDFKTYFARDGQEGLEKFQIVDPDYTFLDIVMPKKSGLDLLKEMKQVNPEAIVIIITSYNTQQNIKIAKDLGANWFLKKPFTKEKFIEIIDHFEKKTV